MQKSEGKPRADVWLDDFTFAPDIETNGNIKGRAMQTRVSLSTTSDFRKFVRDGIEEIESVKSLPAINRNGLITEMASYFSCVEKMAASKIKAGEHLFNVKKLSMSEGTFKELASSFNIDIKRGYRLIGLYERLQKLLPAEALITAPEDLGSVDPNRPFGNYQNVIDVKSLPKSKDLSVWRNFWASKEEANRKNWGERHKGTIKPKEEVLKNLYNSFSRGLRQAAPQYRTEVLESIVGMMMHELNIKSNMVFKPRPVPDGYKPKRGRPRGKKH